MGPLIDAQKTMIETSTDRQKAENYATAYAALVGLCRIPRAENTNRLAVTYLRHIIGLLCALAEQDLGTKPDFK